MLFILLVGFIVVSVALIGFLLRKDRGPKEPVGALWEAAGFGLAATFLASILEGLFVPAGAAAAGLGTMGLAKGIVVFVLVGFIEEGAKFWPLARFVYKKRYFNELTDGIIYFTVAGLSFGLAENILYTLTYGAGVGVLRLILIPIFHGATTGIIGYFLARAKVRQLPFNSVIPVFCAVALLHGLYDFGLASGVVLFVTLAFMLTLCITTGYFLYYMRATEGDRELGLSAQNNNNFCVACGRPNPRHTLYCEHCGHKT